MTGEAHWITPVLVLAGVMLIFVLNLVGRAGRRLPRFERWRLVCPGSGRHAVATIGRADRSGLWVVVSCTEHGAGDPSCEQRCLADLQGRPHPGP